MARVLPVVVALFLAVYAVIDCLQTEPGRIRSLNKGFWLVIIIVIPVVGPILWLAAAKRRSRPRPARPATPPPPAPDDDPEFLRQLRNLDDEHEQLLNDWEANLRRREEELRKEDDADSTQRPPKRPDRDSPEEELGNRTDSGDDESR